MFWTSAPCQMHDVQIFPPFCGPTRPLLTVPSVHRSFSLDRVHFLVFSSVVCAFGVISKKTFPNPMS